MIRLGLLRISATYVNAGSNHIKSLLIKKLRNGTSDSAAFVSSHEESRSITRPRAAARTAGAAAATPDRVHRLPARARLLEGVRAADVVRESRHVLDAEDAVDEEVRPGDPVRGRRNIEAALARW